MPEEEIKRIVGEIFTQALENRQCVHYNMLMRILDPEIAIYLPRIAELVSEKVKQLEKAKSLQEEIDNLENEKYTLERAIGEFGTPEPEKISKKLAELMEEHRKIQIEMDRMQEELEAMREQYDRMQNEIKEG
ncbi:MAG: hypothetical protein ACP5G5_04535 [Thermoplasmata archaeon]|jgi:chromosome segregation ATPase